MTARAYITGFGLSVVATIAAYLLVVTHAFAPPVLLVLVVALAIFQLVTQLTTFLHINRRSPPWRLAALAFTLVLVGIVVAGSLWIMASLNGRMTPDQAQMLDYMQQEAGSP